jgi:hypothetical protein
MYVIDQEIESLVVHVIGEVDEKAGLPNGKIVKAPPDICPMAA